MALVKRNTAYSVNAIVNTKFGTKLKCTTAGTTSTDPLILGGTSPITDGTVVWEVQEESGGGGQGLVDYEANKNYNIGDIVIYNNKIYKCITAHTSTSTFDATKWTEISPSDKGLSIWQANTEYSIDDIVIDSNLIWQCTTAHTSTTTFDESKWVCISGGEISNGYEIVPLWEGVGNVLNQVLTLNDSYNNYDYILGSMADGAGVAFASNILETISGNGLYIMGVLANSGVKRAFLQFSSNQATITEATGLDSSKYISKLQGIRKAKPIVSSGMKYETLWSGTEGSTSSEGISTINLSDNVNKYKSLRLILTCYQGSSVRPYTRDIDMEEYIDFITNGASNYEFGVAHDWYSSSDQYFTLLYDSTNTQLHIGYKRNVLTKVIGISEGVQIPTGVQAARVTLWEGFYNTSNNSHTSTPNYFTISDSIKNYDQFEVTMIGNKDGDNNYSTATQIYNVADVTFDHSSSFRVFSVGGDRTSFEFQLISDTQIAITYRDISQYWPLGGITKITGIKYIQPDSYSTQEKLIGTWIDGKPLYRRVFTGTAPSSANVNTNIFTDPLFTNVDMCYVKDGYIKRDAGSGDIDFYTINESNDSAYSSRIFISCSESSIRGAVGQQFTSRPLVVIVEYTKTTD